MGRLIAPLGVLVLLCACQGTDRNPTDDVSATPPDEGVVARYEGGEVTVGDVDARILQLSPAERLSPGPDLEAWYAEVVRNLVVDRLLLEAAREAGLGESDEFRLNRSNVARQFALQSCLAEVRPGVASVTEEELEAAYEERRARFQAPERRATSHIYLRKGLGESIEAVESRALALRERVLRGESFSRIAREASDSESRHRQGSLEWIVRGQLPEAFESVIFSLEEGVPSRPVVTADGVHLFQVDDVLAERELSRQEAFPMLRSELAAERVATALEELSDENHDPEVAIVDREALDRLIAEGAEDETVLSAGDHSLSLRDFRVRLGRFITEQRNQGQIVPGVLTNDLAWQLLERLYRHERAYEHCMSEGLVNEERLAERLADWEARALTAQMRQQRLQQRVMEKPEELELYYQSNIGQFTPPVQWNLERLRIPFEAPAEGRALMARLESISRNEAVDIETLQRELGGEVEALGWVSLDNMRRINPKLPARVAPLDEGQPVAPLRINQRVEFYRVAERRQFDPRPFEEVREEVAAAYLRQYTSETYEEVAETLLSQADFELFEDRLADLREQGMPGQEISVEELDALLSES
jgi:peptidylprolyl isomerase